MSRAIEPGIRFKQAWVCEGHKQLSRTEADPSPQEGRVACLVSVGLTAEISSPSSRSS